MPQRGVADSVEHLTWQPHAKLVGRDWLQQICLKNIDTCKKSCKKHLFCFGTSEYVRKKE